MGLACRRAMATLFKMVRVARAILFGGVAVAVAALLENFVTLYRLFVIQSELTSGGRGPLCSSERQR